LNALSDHKSQTPIHRCGFTEKVLPGTLRSSDFKRVASMKHGASYIDFEHWLLRQT
jgi:poly-beta-hydroxyalkanoate depolymerase